MKTIVLIIEGFFKRALLIAIFCFSPPEREKTFSPTIVSIPFSKLKIFSYIPTFFAVSITKSLCSSLLT